MPKFNQILLKLEGFKYAKSLDLNMGYYNIRLSKNTSNLCIIILLLGEYCYKLLQMGVANSPEIFQHKMNDLFHGFKFISACIDELLVLTKRDYTDHVQKLELTLNKLQVKGLKCCIENSFFRQTEMGYLCFQVTYNGVKPINRQI